MNTPNPALVGLTDQEKRMVNARKWQSENREKYREYQREYQRSYIKDPRKVATRLQRRIDEVTSIMERMTKTYHLRIDPYQAELDQLTAEMNETQAKIDAGDFNHKKRYKQE